MYYLYILWSQKLNGFYVGFTITTPTQRLQKHLSSKKGHTAKAKDWIIVYTEKYPTKAEAMQREKTIKQWKSRTKIEALIATNITE